MLLTVSLSVNAQKISLGSCYTHDEGLYQAYTIHECRQLEMTPGQLTPEKVDPSVYDLVYECHANVSGRDRMFRLYYNLRSTTPLWRINKTFVK